MNVLIDCAYLLGLAVLSPKIIYRMIRRKRYLTGWGQRLGKISRRYPEKPCIWIHAVSVGEVNATKTVIAALSDKLAGYEIVLSSTTDTGYERATALYDDRIKVFYFPFDFSTIMRRAFKNIRPAVCILMELELWPNLTTIAEQNNIPVVVVNGRISDRSFPKYRLIKPLVRKIFSKVSVVLAQSDEYAQRFIALGCKADRVQVTNSLKYDTAQITDKVDGVDKLAGQLNIGNERIWVAGGTGPGEEKIILETFAELKRDKRLADLRLVLVPRKPERFDEAAALVGQFGFGLVRYSRLKDTNEKISTKPAVVLGDTMGDLRKFYCLATVVFVGRTLAPMGGSDMIEPAALARCTTFGPHTFNFKQTAKALLSDVGAIEAADAEQLYDITHKCLTNADFAAAIAANGRRIIRQNQGATEKTVAAILNLLKPAKI